MLDPRFEGTKMLMVITHAHQISVANAGRQVSNNRFERLFREFDVAVGQMPVGLHKAFLETLVDFEVYPERFVGIVGIRENIRDPGKAASIRCHGIHSRTPAISSGERLRQDRGQIPPVCSSLLTRTLFSTTRHGIPAITGNAWPSSGQYQQSRLADRLRPLMGDTNCGASTFAACSGLSTMISTAS